MAGAIAGTALAVAVAFIGDWEGLRLNSYRDIVGVWTICYGETKGVGPNMQKTKAECDELFAKSISEHEQGMRRCLTNPGPTLKQRVADFSAKIDGIPTGPYIAFVSLSYNIGYGGFCNSSLPRLINAGNIRAACDALPLFNRAGGKVSQGLVNRRAAERKLCLEGLQ
ncbi:MAG: lysozyme [Xanthobacteraceae bacterium]|nr:lysozyme [Xanthobacteraceae bacterium]MCW5678466.1 lysozyme [Xanthobacteraceae bacterium]